MNANHDGLIVAGVAVAAVVALAWYMKRQAESAVSGAWKSITDTIGEAVDYTLALPGRAIDATFETVRETRQDVADSNPTNPGYQLPAGWYRVNTRFGTVITRYPDSMKTINPYDTLGLIDP
jgi:hypothetical protein